MRNVIFPSSIYGPCAKAGSAPVSHSPLPHWAEIPLELLPEKAHDPEKWLYESSYEIRMIWMELRREYLNLFSEFRDRKHGTAATYNAGCRGPHCRLAARRKERAQKGWAESDRSIDFDPIIEHLGTILKEVKEDAIIDARERAINSLEEDLQIRWKYTEETV